MRTFVRLSACLALSACTRSHAVTSFSDRDSGALPDTGPAADANTAHEDIDASIREQDAGAPQGGLAHNIIVFMGDGMGHEQLTTGRYAKEALRVDAMRGPAFANTDSASASVTDSAAAATVIATGVRVKNGVVSLAEDGTPLQTVLEACQQAGKATGLVTTSYFYDASPAAFGAHAESRSDYAEIIDQLLTVTRPDVIMGGENRAALSRLFPDYDLAAALAAADYFVVRGRGELDAWDPPMEPRMIGLFATDFVPNTPGASEAFTSTPVSERREDSPDPLLKTMVARALDRLGTDPDGFFLFAEDETFDQIGHRAELPWSNAAYPAQAAAFDDAVAVAIDWVLRRSSFADTLIVVLADHETGGYQYDRELGPESGRFEGAGRHTRALVPVFVLGPGQDAIEAIHEHADVHRLLLGAVP